MIWLIVINELSAGGNKSDQAIYTVIAEKYEDAQSIALGMHNEELEKSSSIKLEIDHDLSFEITCAPDINGVIHNITSKLTSKRMHEKVSQAGEKGIWIAIGQ